MGDTRYYWNIEYANDEIYNLIMEFSNNSNSVINHYLQHDGNFPFKIMFFGEENNNNLLFHLITNLEKKLIKDVKDKGFFNSDYLTHDDLINLRDYIHTNYSFNIAFEIEFTDILYSERHLLVFSLKRLIDNDELVPFSVAEELIDFFLDFSTKFYSFDNLLEGNRRIQDIRIPDFLRKRIYNI